jgi:hypothetical protein
MRKFLFALSSASLVAFAACGPQPAAEGGANANSNTPATSSPPAAGAQTAGGLPPVTSAHGGGAPAAPPAGGGAAAPSVGGASAPGVDTKALDAKIEQAEAKAKASGAGDADKKAAAAAYVERGNVYYSAGAPALYKFALGDFRRALKYDPANSEAREKMTQIVQIYESMGRPVPANGLEQ